MFLLLLMVNGVIKVGLCFANTSTTMDISCRHDIAVVKRLGHSFCYIKADPYETSTFFSLYQVLLYMPTLHLHYRHLPQLMLLLPIFKISVLIKLLLLKALILSPPSLFSLSPAVVDNTNLYQILMINSLLVVCNTSIIYGYVLILLFY